MAIESEIRQRITKSGYINISTLMSICMSELDYSYYKSQEAISDAQSPNDFLTSPSASQMFGEIIALWCIETWQNLGSPENFNLIEFGSGDGSLLFDILRTTQKICPQFYSAANVKIIDINQKLIQKQEIKLSPYLQTHNSKTPKIAWYKSFQELKNQIRNQTDNQTEGQTQNQTQTNTDPTKSSKTKSTTKSILIANEFFDALPINQYTKIGKNWHETVLTIDEITKRPKFSSIRLVQKFSSILNEEHPNAIDGSVYEESHESISLIKEIADFFASENYSSENNLSESSSSERPQFSENTTNPSSSNPSASSPSENQSSSPTFSFLIIDYGYDIPNYTRSPLQYKATLQAIKSHKYVPILSTLGQADLSAHVNFHKLKEIARLRFLKTEGAISQHDFLISYGIKTRKEMLINKNAGDKELLRIINTQYDRLLNKMGSLFKCLVIKDF